MKIQKLTVKNWLGSATDEYEFSQLTVFAGPNESGKSRIANAISFVLTDRIVREVTKKKDFHELISEGKKTASITLEADNVTSTRTLPNGQKNMLGDGSVLHSHYLPYCVDIHAFSSMPIADRREFLINLTGAAASKDDIRERMAKRSLDADKCEMVAPMLTSGFEAAEDYAKDQARQEKANWRAVTGKTWSPRNGEDWEPDAVEAIELEYQAGEHAAKMQEADDYIQNLMQKKADIEVRLKLASNPLFDASALDSRKKEISENEKKLDELKKSLANLEPNASALLCPQCGASLEIHEAKLVHAGDQKSDTNRKIVELAQKIARGKEQVQNLEDRRQQIVGATTNEGEATEGALNTLVSQINKAIARKESLESAYRDYQSAESQRDRNATAKSKADQHHGHVTQWLDIADAMGPEGIPAEIVGKALQEFNNSLQAYSSDSGLPLAMIDSDMGIRYRDRPYHLNSESAQWRADLMLTMAIAQLSGIGFVVIDRLDILDLRSRQQVMSWLYGMSDIVQCVVMATLKAPMQVGGSIKAYWLGEAKNVQ